MNSKIRSNSMLAMLLAGAFGLAVSACASDSGGGSNNSSGSSSGSGSSSSGSGSSSSGSSSSGSSSSGSSSSGSSSSGSSSSGSSSSGSSSSGSGSSSSGSSSSSGGGGNTVTFSKGQAVGPMAGWGWIALGSADSASSPTCDTGTPITSTTACTTSTVWSSDSALCITGSIPALPATPAQADYDSNWGVQIGVNATADEPTGAIGKSFSSISLKFSGTPTSGLRAELHKLGDPAGTTYCLDGIKSGQSLDVTKFNTACWDGSGKSLSASDTANVDKVGLQVSSGAAAITVSNLCLESITLN